MVVPKRSIWESRFPSPNGVGANVRVGEPGLGSGIPEGIPHVAPIERVLCWTDTKQPPAKAGGFELRTESPDTRRLNDAS